MKILILLCIIINNLISTSILAEKLAEPLVIYSARKTQQISPLLNAFTKKTGIKTELMTGDAGPLLQRIITEGAATKADILFTVDAGNLWLAAEKDILQQVTSTQLEKNIPPHLRDPKNRWFGFSVRARTMIFNSKKVKNSELSTYENLAEKTWLKRICLRSSQKVYNQSLVALLIKEFGEKKVENILKGWVNNLATAPFSSDDLVIQAIEAGQCDVGIVNTYYFAEHQRKNPKTPVQIFWANQKTSGVHINISGAGLTKYAKNSKAALEFLEWLSSVEAQNIISDINLEFPANPAAKTSAIVSSWGAVKMNEQNLAIAGELQSRASILMDRAGYK
ncbi:MAG: extracellular solute-binding protein [Oligoflexales bacterium]|nr:extracellular solute-binding protein [Oligoflexales bacterium]